MNEPTPKQIISALKDQAMANMTPEEKAKISAFGAAFDALNPIQKAIHSANTVCELVHVATNLTREERRAAWHNIHWYLNCQIKLEVYRRLAKTMKDNPGLPFEILLSVSHSADSKHLDSAAASFAELVSSLELPKEW